MTTTALDLQQLIAVNASAGLNRLAGFEVVAAGEGAAEIRMPGNTDFTRYAGYLHAGMIAALLDTVCGFAAATLAVACSPRIFR
jgi:acyl-coenzyme A thioesterase PaaI-like protein